LFYAYQWYGNFVYQLQTHKTYLSSETIHRSPLFYLVIFGCASSAFIIDLFIETIKVNLLGRPTQYIRAKINKGKEITPEIEHKFEELRKKYEEYFIKLDIKRENYLKNKREKRMEKLTKKLEENRAHRKSSDAKIEHLQENKEPEDNKSNENDV